MNIFSNRGDVCIYIYILYTHVSDRLLIGFRICMSWLRSLGHFVDMPLAGNLVWDHSGRYLREASDGDI